VWDAYDTLRRNEADIADKADGDKGRVGDHSGRWNANKGGVTGLPTSGSRRRTT
jgi:hypothetical protein